MFQLPVRQGTIRPRKNVPRAGLRYLADLRQQLHISSNPQTWTIIAQRLALAEVQAFRQMRDRPAAIVVFHNHWARKRR